MKLFLSGNEAIGFGLVEAGVRFLTGYPGTPSSEILPTAIKLKKMHNLDAYFEWSVNEKSAFEEATAASIAGVPSAFTCKQVGLNVAMDPFMNTAMVGTPGGLVVVSADDPGPHSSQTEQDSRFLAMFAKIPVLDPSSPKEAYEMAKRALDLSREYSIPVMLRTLTRISHSRQDIETSGISGGKIEVNFKKQTDRYAATPHFRYILHRELNEKIERIRQTNSSLLEFFDGESVIITSGISFSYLFDIVEKYNLEADVKLIKVEMPYPLNVEPLQRMLKDHEGCCNLVVEESYPVVEMQLTDRSSLRGRLDGFVPFAGELTPDVIEGLLKKLGLITLKRTYQTASKPFKRPSLCPGCGHRSAFFAIKKVFGDDCIYTGDIGCYTLGLNLKAVDTVHCMGASVSFAFGFDTAYRLGQKRKPIVATIGDSTFFHSGIQPLINAVHNNASFLLVILDNSTVAMTGQQKTPQNEENSSGERVKPVSIEDIVRSCGVQFVIVEDPYNVESVMEILTRAKKYITSDSGVACLILRHQCVYNPQGNVRFSDVYVDEGLCRGCKLCIDEFECPSLVFDQGKVRIDKATCIMCGQCVYSCPFDAIKVRE